MALGMSNPITRFEIGYVRHRMPGSQKLWHNRAQRYLFSIIMIYSLFITAYVLWLALQDPAVFHDVTQLTLYPPIQLATLMACGAGVMLHFSTLYYALSLTASSATSRTGATWEPLMLTGISARRLIRGKWCAAVNLTGRMFLALGFSRIGLSIGLGIFIFGVPGGLFPQETAPGISMIGQWAVIFFLLPLLSLANGLFTAAAGVTGSLLVRKTAPGLATTNAIRMTALLAVLLPILLILLGVLIAQRGAIPETGIFRIIIIIAYAELTMIDNGTIITAGGAIPTDSFALNYYLGGLVALFIYAGLTVALLYIAQRLARWQGLMP